MCLGIPGQIIEIINPDLPLALVDVGGVKRSVNIACIVDEEHPVESCVGDWVLIHVGFALNRLALEEVGETLRFLEEIIEAEEECHEILA